jgi:glycopeptide antibiotics resistance protein
MAIMTAARSKSAFGWAALILWLGILLATLFPFRFRLNNDVRWLPAAGPGINAQGGLLFGRHGVVVSDGPVVPQLAQGDDSSCSIEILLKPASYAGSSAILAFSTKDHPWRMELRQYHDGLILSREGPSGTNRYRYTKRDIPHAFNSTQTVLLTFSSSSKGTLVYLNGRLFQRLPGYSLSRQSTNAYLTLGTDPVHIDTWSGEFRGLTLFERELSPEEVAAEYQNWANSAIGHWKNISGRMVLFTFQEGQGTTIHNLSAAGPDLVIPAIFKLPFKPFLAPPWKEFSLTWDYVNDVLRNIVGFIPLGFALCGYLFMRGKPSHPMLIAVVLGALTSLGIEILQGFLPHRESGMTDILTNTLGTVIGACLVRRKPIATYSKLQA